MLRTGLSDMVEPTGVENHPTTVAQFILASRKSPRCDKALVHGGGDGKNEQEEKQLETVSWRH